MNHMNTLEKDLISSHVALTINTDTVKEHKAHNVPQNEPLMTSWLNVVIKRLRLTCIRPSKCPEIL